MSSYIVNVIHDIESKKYLELGIYHGHNFNSILAKNKVSVDSTFPAKFNMTTDRFFSQLDANEKFDVIYIDACHDYNFVIRDFNNAIKHLNEDGIILVHDLIPDSEELTGPQYCGDSFKVLAHILSNQKDDFKFFSLDFDYGLTVFINPKKKISFDSNFSSFSYKDFSKLLSNYKRLSIDESQELIKGFTTPKLAEEVILEEECVVLPAREKIVAEPEPKKKTRKSRKSKAK